MAGLFELLMDAQKGDEDSKISHVGQIARLREFAERLQVPCPFKVGELVTPRAYGNVKGAGEPHLVISLHKQIDLTGGDSTSAVFAAKRDLRVACIMRGHECLFYVWSGDFEPYVVEAA